jgi:hypothetical protein
MELNLQDFRNLMEGGIGAMREGIEKRTKETKPFINYFEQKKDEIFSYFVLTSEAKKIQHNILIPFTITSQLIEDIVVDAIEGGIGYWCCLDNTTPEWENRPEKMPVSQWAVNLLLNNKPIKLEDTESEEVYELTLEKLLKGFSKAIAEYNVDIECVDAETGDIIVQLALFDEIVFG